MEYLFANNLEQRRMHRTEPNIFWRDLCANKKFRLAGAITVCSLIIGSALFLADKGRRSYPLIIALPFLIIAAIGLICVCILVCAAQRKFRIDTNVPRPPMGTPETTVAVISRAGTDQLQMSDIIPPPRREDTPCLTLSYQGQNNLNSRIEAATKLATRIGLNSQIQAEIGLVDANLRDTETGPIRRAIAPVDI